MIDYLNELNEKQYEAVSTDALHVRIVAGAGSGKTRVLTYRIAYLLEKMNVEPWRILAITFTNKVANEMKDRVTKLVPVENRDLTIKTFHSFAAFFLRKEITVLGFPASFTILDEEDQEKLIKDIASEMGFKRNDPIVKRAINYIAAKKGREQYPDDIPEVSKPTFEGEKDCLEIYRRYEEQKNRMFCLDFDDLLLKTNYILENYLDIAQKWRVKYDHILVDEFQDTNNIEYKMLSYLLNDDTALYVVGDPDQTIYTWRGANQNIILYLPRQFLDIETITLERNYRSTQAILDSANLLIKNNKMRLEKNLYTENKKGEPIVTKCCSTTRSEADYISRTIRELVAAHRYSYNDIAILYRSNYITQEFEQNLTSNHIPYRIYGGTKFYQRREIKDVLAYLNLLVNERDDISFERIINVPRRNIGDTSVAALKAEAKEKSMGLYEFVKWMDKDTSPLTFSATLKLQSLVVLLNETRKRIKEKDEVYSKIIEDLLASINYYDYLLKDDDGEERVENVKALIEDLRHFLKSNPDSSFEEYLQNIALLSAQDEVVDGEYVTLMTIHTAKGLEYPVVFIVRVNETILPNMRALESDGYKALEEERRLFYVAITRAKEKLYLSFSTDYSYVSGGTLRASRFLKESGNEVKTMPPNGGGTYNPYAGREIRRPASFFDDIIDDEPPAPKKVTTPSTNGITDWAVGDKVIHRTFGEGVVIALLGDDIIEVNFKEHGKKQLMGNHPAIKKGE